MKYLVISDTHSKVDCTIKYIKNNILKKNDIEAIFFLGDYVEDGELIGKKLNLKTYIVAGNGDYGSGYNEDLLLEINDKKILLTHGHRYRLGYNLDTLCYKGEEVGADIILYGHTHIPIYTIENDIIILNPGSPSYPRTNNNKKTFAILDIDKEVKVEFIEI